MVNGQKSNLQYAIFQILHLILKNGYRPLGKSVLLVFIISICSLLMSIYLLIKRNTFIYQTAGSGYPVDER